MNARERFIAHVLGQPVDRPPYWLYWSPWDTTRERWLREGMAEGTDPRAPFGSDRVPATISVNCGPCPPIEQTVLEEDDQFLVHRDAWGIVRQDFKDHMSMSAFLQFPAKE